MSGSFNYKDEEESTTLNLQDESQIIHSPNFDSLFLIFSDLTKSFDQSNFQEFLANIDKLVHQSINDRLTFNLFLAYDNSSLFEFFEQTSSIFEKSDNETKEIIVKFYEQLIQTQDFANKFSEFEGDLLFAKYFLNVTENYDNIAINIFMHMKYLSSEFPIWLISDYFKEKMSDYRFLILFVKMIDRTPDINQLFSYLDLFPSPQIESFAEFCHLLILFLKNKVDESLFVEKDYLRQLSELLPYVDISIAKYFLQIVARLSSNPKVLEVMKPDLLFSFLVHVKSPDIIIPTTAIIDSMIRSEVLMPAHEFLSTYVNQDVIFSLLENLSDYPYPIRIRSLALLNSFIVSFNYEILGTILEYNHANDGTEITEIVYSLLGSDNPDILIAALQFAYHMIVGVQKIPDDDTSIITMIAQWNEIGIDDLINELISSDVPQIHEEAEKVYTKLKSYLQLTE